MTAILGPVRGMARDIGKDTVIFGKMQAAKKAPPRLRINAVGAVLVLDV